MPLDSTVGGASSNSYESLAEFKTYLTTRLHVPAAVTATDDTAKTNALIGATTLIENAFQKRQRLDVQVLRTSVERVYITPPYWTGTPATTTQRLSWPRDGMFDRNGNAIADTVIPQELKDAESEAAIALIVTDLTANNDVINQGLKQLKAGPISLMWKDFIPWKLLPDIVYTTLVAGWLTNEIYAGNAIIFKAAG